MYDAYSDYLSNYTPEEAQGVSQGGGTLPQGMDQMQMAGLLLASGMPFSKAIIATAGMQQQANARALQNYKIQALQQKMQADNDLVRQLGGDPMTSSSLSMSAPPINITAGNAPTLADMNAMPAGAPTSAQAAAIPTSPATAATPSQGLYANIDPTTRQMAVQLIRSGDRAGALKLLNDAKQQELPGGFQRSAINAGRGTLGSTVTNPQTGESRSINTTEMTTNDQSAIGAVDRVVPQLNDIINTLPQFQFKPKAALENVEGWANEYLGTNFDLPSKRAKGLSLINTAAEGMMKAYKLPSTDEAIAMVKSAISPRAGESPDLYEARLKAERDNLLMFQKQAQDRLTQGTLVQGGNAPQQAIQMPPQPISRADIARQILAQRQAQKR